MVLSAVMEQLKTGSITNINTRGNYIVYPAGNDNKALMAPYVLVYDDYAVSAYYIQNNSIQPLIVDVHYPVGFIDELNKYVEYEIPELLNNKRLTDDEGFTFQVYVSMYLSIMGEPNDDKSITGGNDDGTISRFRRIFVPRRG